MPTRRVLIVDDEERIQEVIQTCLEILNGWQVTTAGSGKDAIARALAEQPEAILLDVSMPDMDGLTVLQALRKQPQTQAIPVIFLTAKVQPADQAAFAQLAIAGVINKPFDPLTLAAQVAQILNWA